MLERGEKVFFTTDPRASFSETYPPSIDVTPPWRDSTKSRENMASG